MNGLMDGSHNYKMKTIIITHIDEWINGWIIYL